MLQYVPANRDFEKGVIRSGQLRGQAWTLRTLAHAAYITPDNHPLKKYFLDRVDFNLQFFNTNYTQNPNAPTLGFMTHWRIVFDEGGRGMISPWNDDAFTMVVGFLADMGFQDAIGLRNWKVKFIYGRFSNDPVFCKHRAATTRYVVQDVYDESAPLADSWADLQLLSFPDIVGNCPSTFDHGRPYCTECVLAITRGALATAVAAGFADARDHLDYVTQVQEDAGADFNVSPHWAIVPR
jgi:hypothetical protein